MRVLLAAFLTDGYKLDHRRQYPKGTTLVYSNLTPRTCNYYPVAYEGAVVFGMQYAIKHYLVEWFNESFFNRDVNEVCKEYQELLDSYLGPNTIGTDHIRALHELGYLPIRIKALPEGSLCPLRVPMLTIENTNPDFFWLTNYLETLLSTSIWLPTTSATTARLFKKELIHHARKTGFADNDLSFLCHDFSMRGMGDIVSGMASAMGHLTSFNGTENLTALVGIKQYYNTDYAKTPFAGTVPATEHSVMCAGGMEDEFGTFKRLITEVYPKGFVSIVSDTWDFWKVIDEYLPKLKDIIMARDGRVVIRPDSGDPADIICGVQYCDIIPIERKGFFYYKNYLNSEAKVRGEVFSDCFNNPEKYHKLTVSELKGAYQCLYEIFGGKINSKGFKELDSHIGMIYGESITLDVQKDIYKRLEDKGFAASNLVLGVGLA